MRPAIETFIWDQYVPVQYQSGTQAVQAGTALLHILADILLAWSGTQAA